MITSNINRTNFNKYFNGFNCYMFVTVYLVFNKYALNLSSTSLDY